MKKILIYSLFYFIFVGILIVCLISTGDGLTEKTIKITKHSLSVDVFNWSVYQLNSYGKYLGGYKAFNIILFAVLWPSLILYFMILSFYFFQRKERTFYQPKLFWGMSAFYFVLVFVLMGIFLADKTSHIELKLFQENTFFYQCCNVVISISKMTSFTYESLNVAVFVVLQPALILYFSSAALYLFRVSNATETKT